MSKGGWRIWTVSAILMAASCEVFAQAAGTPTNVNVCASCWNLEESNLVFYVSGYQGGDVPVEWGMRFEAFIAPPYGQWKDLNFCPYAYKPDEKGTIDSITWAWSVSGDTAPNPASGDTPIATFSNVSLGHGIFQITASGSGTYREQTFQFTESYSTSFSVVLVLKVDIVPDWNHDRAITSADENQATASKPFRFWINDDNDYGDISDGDSDLPGEDVGGNFQPDYYTDDVDGRSDLLDFFPVWLDLKQTLDLLPPSGTVQYKLRQADSAVNAVYTDLTKGQAGNFLTTEGNTYGPSFNEDSYDADTFEVTSSGVVLDEDFLDKIINDENKGVLMIEGAGETTAPLVLEVWKDGAKICEAELPLSIAGVEKMYRWVNLRHVTGGAETRATDTNEPANYPDALCNGKQFVFVHGFNSSESGARGWNAEVFKRLDQAGSRAMYTAVTWQGDETPGKLPPGAYYHADVINAFQAASNLAAEITALPGQKYLAAHSLGNMVASSAIVDHGLNPERYFMIDAAVAMEAYKASERQPGDIAISPWPSYTNRVWASEWYSLFDAPDGRYYLSWRGRFGNISQAINYYSLGEDVLNNNESGEEVSPFDAPERVWISQEQVKGGILPAILIGVDSHGGWGFNGEYSTGVYDPSNDVYVTAATPAEAALLQPYMLRAHSFFKSFYDDDLYGTNGSAVATNAEVRGKVLAEAIPATSRAAGRNPIADFGVGGVGNVDLMTKNTGWPRANENWLHSDFKNVAFPYVHQFFEDVVAKGGLQ